MEPRWWNEIREVCQRECPDSFSELMTSLVKSTDSIGSLCAILRKRLECEGETYLNEVEWVTLRTIEDQNGFGPGGDSD